MVKSPRCDKTVYSNEAVKVAGGDWHSGCVRCKECQCSLNVKTAVAHQGDVFCKVHIPKPKATTVADSVDMVHAKQAQATKNHSKETGVKSDSAGKEVHAGTHTAAPPRAESAYSGGDDSGDYQQPADNYGGESADYGQQSNEYGSGEQEYQEDNYE